MEYYLDDSNDVWKVDTEGKEYTISYKNGEWIEVEKGSIDPYWGGCSEEYAKNKQEEIKGKLAKNG